MKDVQKYETLIEDIVLDSDSLQVTTCHTKAAKYLTLAEIVAKEESEIKAEEDELMPDEKARIRRK